MLPSCSEEKIKIAIIGGGPAAYYIFRGIQKRIFKNKEQNDGFDDKSQIQLNKKMQKPAILSLVYDRDTNYNAVPQSDEDMLKHNTESQFDKEIFKYNIGTLLDEKLLKHNLRYPHDQSDKKNFSLSRSNKEISTRRPMLQSEQNVSKLNTSQQHQKLDKNHNPSSQINKDMSKNDTLLNSDKSVSIFEIGLRSNKQNPQHQSLNPKHAPINNKLTIYRDSSHTSKCRLKLQLDIFEKEKLPFSTVFLHKQRQIYEKYLRDSGIDLLQDTLGERNSKNRMYNKFSLNVEESTVLKSSSRFIDHLHCSIECYPEYLPILTQHYDLVILATGGKRRIGIGMDGIECIKILKNLEKGGSNTPLDSSQSVHKHSSQECLTESTDYFFNNFYQNEKHSINPKGYSDNSPVEFYNTISFLNKPRHLPHLTKGFYSPYDTHNQLYSDMFMPTTPYLHEKQENILHSTVRHHRSGSLSSDKNPNIDILLNSPRIHIIGGGNVSLDLIQHLMNTQTKLQTNLNKTIQNEKSLQNITMIVRNDFQNHKFSILEFKDCLKYFRIVNLINIREVDQKLIGGLYKKGFKENILVTLKRNNDNFRSTDYSINTIDNKSFDSHKTVSALRNGSDKFQFHKNTELYPNQPQGRPGVKKDFNSTGDHLNIKHNHRKYEKNDQDSSAYHDFLDLYDQTLIPSIVSESYFSNKNEINVQSKDKKNSFDGSVFLSPDITMNRSKNGPFAFLNDQRYTSTALTACSNQNNEHSSSSEEMIRLNLGSNKNEAISDGAHSHIQLANKIISVRKYNLSFMNCQNPDRELTIYFNSVIKRRPNGCIIIDNYTDTKRKSEKQMENSKYFDPEDKKADIVATYSEGVNKEPVSVSNIPKELAISPYLFNPDSVISCLGHQPNDFSDTPELTLTKNNILKVGWADMGRGNIIDVKNNCEYMIDHIFWWLNLE